MTDLFSAPTDTGSWKRHLAVLQQRLGPAEVDGWFQDARLVSHDKTSAQLALPSQLHLEWIRKRHLKTLQEVLGVERIELVVEDALNDAPSSLPAPRALSETAPATEEEIPAPAGEASAVPAAAHRVEGGDGTLVLNADYTFDNYVVGAGNRFAHAAARGVADRPAVAFNPLFLHGSVGLGKTHLMQAVAHHLLEARQGLRIVFLSCEQFVNHFIGALRRGSLESFRQRYRRADVLVVDDIHLLANKARTQEEFFHTFNELHNARKQIVLSSDSPPEDIPSLQEQLVSRFKW
ncbi:MAG: DnaA ATPase domain-containing protein, partial [Planctomycetota bacterium]